MPTTNLIKAFFLLPILFLCISFPTDYSKSTDVKLENVQYDETLRRYKINDDIIVFTGDSCHYTLITSGSDATLIDTGSSTKDYDVVKAYLDQNSLKLRNVFITHMHLDHNFNLEAFSKLSDKAYVPEALKNNQVIEMGDKSFKAIKTPGHNSDEDVAIELVKEHILVAGDTVAVGFIPILNNQGTAQKYIASLNYIKDQNYNIIVPGHGKLIEPELMLAPELGYLENCYNKVKVLKDSGANLGRCLKEINVFDCVTDTNIISEDSLPVFIEYHKHNISLIYDSI